MLPGQLLGVFTGHQGRDLVSGTPADMLWVKHVQSYNNLSSEGAGRLAEPLGKLVNLTRLDLVRACGHMPDGVQRQCLGCAGAVMAECSGR